MPKHTLIFIKHAGYLLVTIENFSEAEYCVQPKGRVSVGWGALSWGVGWTFSYPFEYCYIQKKTLVKEKFPAQHKFIKPC